MSKNKKTNIINALFMANNFVVQVAICAIGMLLSLGGMEWMYIWWTVEDIHPIRFTNGIMLVLIGICIVYIEFAAIDYFKHKKD